MPPYYADAAVVAFITPLMLTPRAIYAYCRHIFHAAVIIIVSLLPLLLLSC